MVPSLRGANGSGFAGPMTSTATKHSMDGFGGLLNCFASLAMTVPQG